MGDDRVSLPKRLKLARNSFGTGTETRKEPDTQRESELDDGSPFLFSGTTKINECDFRAEPENYRALNSQKPDKGTNKFNNKSLFFVSHEGGKTTPHDSPTPSTMESDFANGPSSLDQSINKNVNHEQSHSISSLIQRRSVLRSQNKEILPQSGEKLILRCILSSLTRRGSNSSKEVKVLLDSGSSTSIVTSSLQKSVDLKTFRSRIPVNFRGLFSSTEEKFPLITLLEIIVRDDRTDSVCKLAIPAYVVNEDLPQGAEILVGMDQIGRNFGLHIPIRQSPHITFRDSRNRVFSLTLRDCTAGEEELPKNMMAVEKSMAGIKQTSYSRRMPTLNFEEGKSSSDVSSNGTGINEGILLNYHNSFERLGDTSVQVNDNLEFDASIKGNQSFQSDQQEVLTWNERLNFNAFPVTVETIAESDPGQTEILLEIQRIKNMIVTLMGKVDELQRKNPELETVKNSSKAKIKKNSRYQEKVELSKEQLNQQLDKFKRDLTSLRSKLKRRRSRFNHDLRRSRRTESLKRLKSSLKNYERINEDESLSKSILSITHCPESETNEIIYTVDAIDRIVDAVNDDKLSSNVLRPCHSSHPDKEIEVEDNPHFDEKNNQVKSSLSPTDENRIPEYTEKIYSQLNSKNSFPHHSKQEVINMINVVAKRDDEMNSSTSQPAEWRVVSKVREQHIAHALSAGEAQQLTELVGSYPNTLFRNTGSMKMGQATLRGQPVTFDIELVPGGLESVKHKLRKPYTLKRPMRDILKSTQIEMERAGVGFHNPLNFAPEISSPSFFVHQKDKYRWVQDYRVLNSITKDFLYPIPDINFIAENLSGSSYFSILDLKSGYHQIRLSDAAKRLASTITPEGLFQFIVLPFGLKNAPPFFQKYMEDVLKDLKGTICFVYIDDIIVFSRTFEDHLKHLHLVFQALEESNLQTNIDKCHFCLSQIKVLGKIISKDGIKPDPALIDAMTNFPTPLSKTKVKSFLALCNYYRNHIKNFGPLSEKLSSLTRDDVSWDHPEELWKSDPGYQECFDNLKRLMSTAPTLAFPNMEKTFHIQSDASIIGAGAVLYQFDEQGERVVISYGSWLFNSAQRKYNTTERELLALVLATRKWKPFLYHTKFLAETDHQALEGYLNLEDPFGKIARWAAELSQFGFGIKYIKGKTNIPADTFSRSFQEMALLEHIFSCSINEVDSKWSNAKLSEV